MNNPLVSVVVITYNSVDFILELLTSIYNQDYPNIELIISDDFSTDNTIDICRTWLLQNGSRFNGFSVKVPESNHGIPANCNQGVLASNGKWVKIIAGDDILLKNCISANVDFATNNNFSIIFSDLLNFNVNGPYAATQYQQRLISKFIAKSSVEKRKSFIRHPFFLNIPTLFYSRELYNEINGYDEKFRLLEDQPYILKLLNANVDIGYLPQITVMYRQHNTSVIKNASSNLISSLYECYLDYRRPVLKSGNLKDRLFLIYNEFNFYCLKKGFNNKKLFRFFNRIAHKIIAA